MINAHLNFRGTHSGGQGRFLSAKLPQQALPFALTAIFLLNASSANAAKAVDYNSVEPRMLDVVGLSSVLKQYPDLTGKSVKMGVISRCFDYSEDGETHNFSPDLSHKSLLNSRITLEDDPNYEFAVSPHATVVCSLLFGLDPNAQSDELGRFDFRGLIPDANAQVFEFRHFVREYVFSGNAADVDLISMSLGSQFEDWWTRGISRLAGQYDIPVIAGIGNGLNSSDPVLFPAAGANVTAVGVVDCVNAPDLSARLASFDYARPEHSSFGPTPNGLCKPDLVAPSNCVAAAANTQTYIETGNWSSFSTAIVSGTAALLLEKADSDPNLSYLNNSRNCCIRAILLNSARKLDGWHKGEISGDDDHYVPLDYLQGAGMLDIAESFKQLTAGRGAPGDVNTAGWDISEVNTGAGAVQIYRLKAPKATKKFAITLVWNMVYGEAYPFNPLPEKSGDLRLELWGLAADKVPSKVIDYSDSMVDNVEHIYCGADENFSDYAIIVKPGRHNTSIISQKYAIAWKSF
jgi:hypothetical protein